MKWSRYTQYKESGIEWLGEVPEHWESKRLKFILSEPLKYGANESAEFDDLTCPRYVRITDISDSGYLREETFKSLPEDIARTYILNEGDLLFARSGATVGKTFLYLTSWGRAAFAGYLIRARLKKPEYLPTFAAYFCRSNNYLTWLQSIFIQATIQNVSAEKYANLIFPVPPFEEQKTISAFLDRETSRIDRLIEKKEKQIGLLKEKRSALISHAVTKGLDPNVKMKDSGIPWLAEIPEEWEVKRLKYISAINDETLTENTEPTFEILYIDIGSVDKYIGITKKENLTFKDAPSRARRIVRNGDVIVSTVRTYLHAIAPVNSWEDNLVVSTGFAVIRTKDELNRKFASFCLRAGYFVDEVVARSVGVVYPAINSSELGNIFIAIPAKEEQNAIATFLERETTKIDALIKKIQKSIELLKEYRTAMISAAVTGKIDVRDTAKKI